MGLLDAQPMQQSAPMQGGLLGGMGGAPQQQGADGKAASLQLANMLRQSPTMETGQAIVQKMGEMGLEGADKVGQMLQMSGGDSGKIKELATMFIQELSK